MVDPWMVWGKDEVWVDVIIVLGLGCCGGRMMSGWTLSWFWPKSWLWPMDALRDGWGLGGRDHSFGPWMLCGTDEVWVDVIRFAHGCS